jgi:hypothetical protein
MLDGQPSQDIPAIPSAVWQSQYSTVWGAPVWAQRVYAHDDRGLENLSRQESSYIDTEAYQITKMKDLKHLDV